MFNLYARPSNMQAWEWQLKRVAIVCSEALMMVTLKKWLKSVTECLHLCTHYFHKKSTNFAADAARTTCTVKNNFFGVPKNKTICAKKKHLDFYNIKNCAGGSSLYLLCTCYSISLNLKNHRFVWFFVEKNTPTLMAFTGVTNALGPSPQPTGFRSPT